MLQNNKGLSLVIETETETPVFFCSEAFYLGYSLPAAAAFRTAFAAIGFAAFVRFAIAFTTFGLHDVSRSG